MLPEGIKKREKTAEEALSSLMRLCSRGERSSGDALRLMRTWGVAERDQSKVLERLLSDRFIDDRRYAEAFVREKLNFSGWGTYKIRAALQRKITDKELIEQALQQAEQPKMEERLRTQFERKMRNMKWVNEYELKTKLVRFGLSRGYDYQTVTDIASEFAKNTDQCDDF